jgi:hypothetical protein
LQVLRIARPTDAIEPLLRFYLDGLGFTRLGTFNDHDGFDGTLIGHRNAPYHLEFTHHRGAHVGRAPSQDHLLVFYFAMEAEWSAACARMERAGILAVTSYNPYWDRAGRTYEDADGYRVVLQLGKSPV